MRILGLIPARGGSKRLPQKHLRSCAGRPLIAWTCEAASAAKQLDAVLVSTDSDEIAAVAHTWGVEAPFLRPSEISRDDSPSLDAVLHALDWLARERNQRFDAVAFLQPTSPLRRSEHVDAAVKLFEKAGADTLVSVCRLPKQLRPDKMMVEIDGLLTPFNRHHGLDDAERFENVFVREGPSILIAQESVLRAGSFYGARTIGFEMPLETFVDIDLAEDLLEAERRLLRSGHSA